MLVNDPNVKHMLGQIMFRAHKYPESTSVRVCTDTYMSKEEVYSENPWGRA